MANFTPQEIEEMLQEFFDVVGKRQYVGARYVPIFGRRDEGTCDWDNSDAYEPLTIVIYQGNSYTSRQYVPKNVDITDTNYWVQTGNWNAQIEQYRQEVLSFQSQIDTLRSDLESDYVPFPDSDFFPKFGILGQVLTTLANGDTKWEDPVTVDAAIAEPLIEAWLDEHPEATTTVEDGAITRAKLNNALLTIMFTYEGLVTTANYQTILPTLADAKTNSLYGITFTSDTHPTDYPVSFGYGTCHLFTYGNNSYKVQYLLYSNPDGRYASRRYFNGSWHDWSIFMPKTTVNAGEVTRPMLNASLDDVLMTYNGSVNDSNYSTLLPTLSAAQQNSVMILSMTQATHQTDYPTNVGYSTMLMLTYGSATVKEQYVMALSKNGTSAHRRYFNNSWQSWEYFSNGAQYLEFVRLVSYLNYETYLPTLADADINTIYNLSMSESVHQTDYPTRMGYPTGNLITYGTPTYKEQLFISTVNPNVYAYRRYYSGSWKNWAYFENSNRTIVIAPSGGDYSNIVSGLAAAYGTVNSNVIIKAGTYDVVAAEKALHGNTYFDDVDFSSGGPKLGNGCKYYFESGAKVECVLPNTASTAAQNAYSPFNAGDGDFEIIGLDVYSENCRYSFHDEMRGVGSYHHIYKDCNMHHNDTGGGYVQCLGGGLGAHGLIDIEGCVFESDTAEATSQGIVSYHNGAYADVKSNVNIRDCYFKNGHVRFSWYGISTDVSNLTVCGCSFKTTDVEERAETPDSTVVNTDVISWNNEIRGA